MAKHNILITGGAGFIGSHVVRHFVKKYPEYNIINLDKLTYAGNLENLKDIEKYPNYDFVKYDICDSKNMDKLFREKEIDSVIHLAAESHVDRSIEDPMCFVKTNVIGTVTLLNSAKDYWESLPEKFEGKRFYQISTDEVYGALTMDKSILFTEKTKYNPHSPYSSSKASADHFVRAYHDTYGMDTIISNCSNNYGPNQFPEKLIPLAINNIRNGRKIPIYGNGENIRDWLYVEDHVKAIDLIFHKGKSGETYNIGGNNEMSNIEIIRTIISVLNPVGDINYDEYIEYVTDRKGHDLRYAIDSTKLQIELGWKPEETFASGIRKTIIWYLKNEEWMNNVTNGEYKKYYNKMYSNR